MPTAAAAALDVRALPGQEVVGALVDFLAPRTFLLVVDNCEHVLGASATLVDTLLRAAPGLTVLATSREPLRVSGEVVFRVPSLAIPDLGEELEPDDLLGFEAVRLFVDRATAAAPEFVLDGENAADVARICVRLDGLPLALELAASRLGALGAAVVAERLDDRFRVLRARSHTAPTRQQTLQATLQWSHDLLEPDERLLFRRLAVFAGGFELAAVESVCGGDGLEQSEVVDVLARLVEKSLVARGDVGRCRALPTAGDRPPVCTASSSRPPARVAPWPTGTPSGRSTWPSAGDRPELDREQANLLAALDTLRAQRPPDALRLCVALWTFWLRRIDLARPTAASTTRWRRCRSGRPSAPRPCSPQPRSRPAAARSRPWPRMPERASSVAEEVGDTRAEWAALHFQGVVCDHVRGRRCARLARACAPARAPGGVRARRGAGDLHARCRALVPRRSQPRPRQLLADGIEAFRALEEPARRIESPINVAEMRVPAGGGRPGVRIVLEDSFQPFVEVTCDAALSYALVNQASVLRVRGDFDRARALLDESDRRFLASGDERGRADVLVRRAYLNVAEGLPEDARDCLERALDYRRRTIDRRGIGLVLNGLGMIDTDAGAHADAERRLEEARGLFRRAGDRWGLVIALLRTADLEVARDRLDAAEAALAEARGRRARDGSVALERAPAVRTGRGGCPPGQRGAGGRALLPGTRPLCARTRTRTASPPSTSGFAALLSRR